MSGVIDPRSKVYAHLDRLAVLQAGGTPPPINVEIDLSNRCSLGCEWCHFAYTHTRGPLAGKRAKPAGAVAGGDLMPVELAKSIVGQLAAAGVASVTWTGGGEPTLHPAFDELVAHTDGLVEQGLYTHGGHIDARRAALLKRALTFVYVSLDAVDADSYQRAKSVDRFDRVCDAIRDLAAADGPATIGVGFLVTERNWQHADAAARLARDLGADYLQLRPTILYSHDTPGQPAEDVSWLDDAIEHLSDVAAGWSGFVQADLARFRMYRRWNGHPYPSCWWASLQTCITPNGKVWTCVNKREHPGAELGDLAVESFADIWARKQLTPVDGGCRVMCRGHLPNLELQQVMQPREHAAFV